MTNVIESFGGSGTIMDYIRHYWISENGPTVSRDLAKRVKEVKQGSSQATAFVSNLEKHAIWQRE